MAVEKRKVLGAVEAMVRRANTRREKRLNVPDAETDSDVERATPIQVDRGRVIGSTQPSGPTTPLS